MGNICNNSEVKETPDTISNRYSAEDLAKIKAIDIRKYSLSIFERFNSIRKNFTQTSALLSSIVSRTPRSQMTFSEEEKRVSEHLQTFLETHEEEAVIIKELSVHLEASSSSTNVPWNEDAFCLFSSHPSNTKYNELITDINKAMNKNLYCTEYSILTFYPYEYAIWHLLLEHKEKYIQLLKDNYICGTVITYKTKGFKTILVLFCENTQNVEIEGYNPVTGAKELLSLKDLCFKDIPYKSQIIKGNYIYSGDVLNVTFKLFNGEIIEENINI